MRFFIHSWRAWNPRLKGAGAITFATLALLTGFRAMAGAPASPAMPGAAVNLDAELARAGKLQQPILLLVIETGHSPADSTARDLLVDAAAKNQPGPVSILFDIENSRNRATAARFHVTNTPALFCLSPKGLIVSRDEGTITPGLLEQRAGEVAQRAPALDAKLAVLEQAAKLNTHDAQAQLAVASFLSARQNAREAIPYLENIARSDTADLTLRVRAWVTLARAHFWVGEAEKGRREAENLISALGKKAPEARAGADLVLGMQDATANRIAQARKELQEAIAMAPASVYARQAVAELAGLPQLGK